MLRVSARLDQVCAVIFFSMQDERALAEGSVVLFQRWGRRSRQHHLCDRTIVAGLLTAALMLGTRAVLRLRIGQGRGRKHCEVIRSPRERSFLRRRCLAARYHILGNLASWRQLSYRGLFTRSAEIPFSLEQ